MKKTQKQSTEKVTAIDNDYVRSMQKKEYLKKAQKIRLRNRLAVFAVIVCIVAGSLFNMNEGQKELLAVKEQEKLEAMATLKDLQAQQEQLNMQLTMLDDDEYIAKLARKEYFLSESNEIIFSIPDKKKESEKEMRKE
ncbi:septum formation initiator [Sporosarcina sp. PTS2304]|uniref:FtsB family cell division protein n=1 Tax=Sporosarcina sp. PTS2304 TaxID=2283194 RepID=UPI000E0D9AF7|nr:septum formation initiator family protein [Sporosarcina sp. PTS2304]AXI00738.1 septum formation initiator [Sporosarcina sp. PTS2304]